MMATAVTERREPTLNFQAPSDDRAISVQNITKVFRADNVTIRAVDDVSFRVEPGERIGILGGNGAGKSTLIKMLAGVIVPTSGTITSGMSISWPLGSVTVMPSPTSGREPAANRDTV